MKFLIKNKASKYGYSTSYYENAAGYNNTSNPSGYYDFYGYEYYDYTYTYQPSSSSYDYYDYNYYYYNTASSSSSSSTGTNNTYYSSSSYTYPEFDYENYYNSYYHQPEYQSTSSNTSSSYKSEFKPTKNNRKEFKNKKPTTSPPSSASSESGFYDSYDDEPSDWYNSQKSRPSSRSSSVYTSADGTQYHDYIQTSKSYSKEEIQNLIDSLVDDPIWWDYFSNPPSSYTDDHKERKASNSSYNSRQKSRSTESINNTADFYDEFDDYDDCYSSDLENEEINCFVDNITKLKNLVKESNIKISKDNRSSEYEITNGNYTYKCKNDLELLQCLKQLTKEQNEKKSSTRTSKKVDEIEVSLSFYDSMTSLNDYKVNYDNEHISSTNLNSHNTHETSSINCNNSNFNLNIEKLNNPSEQMETTKSLKINLDSCNSNCSTSFSSKKQKKIMICNIIAKNNLTNKVNKINSDK